MNKEQLLQELSSKINSGEISQEEIINQFNIKSSIKREDGKKFLHFSVTKMLYVLGAVVVFVGIINFINQIWSDMGSWGRILITLGLGVILAAIGSILTIKKKETSIGMIFHIIGGFLIPGGSLVTLYELDIDLSSLWPFVITFGVITLFYLLLTVVHKNAILTFFTIVNGTAFIYLLTEALINGQFRDHQDIYAYLTMLIGISYLLLTYSFRNNWNEKLIGPLYFLGTVGFLGAAFSRVFNSNLWESLYFLIVFGVLFLSIYAKSRIVLAVSTIFLIIHISYITDKYFADSLGWPISLVILGFIFIGLGYASITIGQKYIKKDKDNS